jgi:hypothetical protein
MMRKTFQEVKGQKIRKNDEKRRFRRSKFKKSEKMMRKDLSGGQRTKFKKSEKMMRKDFQMVERSKIKKSEKMMRKDVSEGQSSKNPKK